MSRAGVDRPVVVLVGFMGAGKSTVGRIVADRLGVDFADTDTEIVTRSGTGVPEIFATSGVDAFRALERDVIVELLTGHRGVLSLGGGAVTTVEVAEALAGHRVVYLSVDPDDGYARVAGTDRPLLAAADPAARYRELLAERTGSYRAVATVEIDGTAGDPEDIADDIITRIARELVPERTS